MMCLLAYCVLVLTASAMWTGEFQAVPGKIEGQYIVVFKPDLHATHREAHLQAFGANMTIIATHSINTFQGYSAQIAHESVVARIKEDPRVKYVEQDGVVTIAQDSCGQQSGLPPGLWGLTRVNERKLNLDGRYVYHNSVAKAVRAYIIDTGILLTHVDFDGRAVYGASFADGNPSDQNGHGTHVASTVGGVLYGVSKTVTLVSVKVIGRNGSASWTNVIRGMEWATTDARSHAINSVANLSVGGSFNQAANDVLDASSAEGRLTWVVASGNSNANACNVSPSSARTALAVGATTNEDRRASFSNFGPCQSMWAPGTNILGAWFTSDTASNTISGTSMSSPHVCGIAADIIAMTPESMTPAQLIARVKSTGTADAIIDGGINGSPNVLAYHRCSST